MLSEHEASAAPLCSSVRQFLIYSTFVRVYKTKNNASYRSSLFPFRISLFCSLIFFLLYEVFFSRHPIISFRTNDAMHIALLSG